MAGVLGPWKRSKASPCEIMVAEGDSVGLTIATVTPFTPPYRETQEAVSNLIAAAPYLIEAAEYLIRQLADGDEPELDKDGDEIDPIERLRDAIALAKGEQTNG